MIWRRKFKLLTVAVILIGAVALIGCSQVPKKLEGDQVIVSRPKGETCFEVSRGSYDPF